VISQFLTEMDGIEDLKGPARPTGGAGPGRLLTETLTRQSAQHPEPPAAGEQAPPRG
jgi:hypothetical protein